MPGDCVCEKEDVMDKDKDKDWLDPETAEEIEIRHLVENTDLSPNQARSLVETHGTDRDRLMEVARTFKAEG